MALTTTYPNPNQTLAAGGLEGATDDVISAAYWNRLAQMVYYLGGTVGHIACRAYPATVQSAPDATYTTLALGAESIDNDPNGAMHDLVTNNSRITIRTTGLYLVSLFVAFAVSNTGVRYVDILVNGGSAIVQNTCPAVIGLPAALSPSVPYFFNANDFVSARVFQNSGGALNIDSATLTVVKL